jgi:hypothetical protein
VASAAGPVAEQGVRVQDQPEVVHPAHRHPRQRRRWGGCRRGCWRERRAGRQVSAGVQHRAVGQAVVPHRTEQAHQGVRAALIHGKARPVAVGGRPGPGEVGEDLVGHLDVDLARVPREHGGPVPLLPGADPAGRDRRGPATRRRLSVSRDDRLLHPGPPLAGGRALPRAVTCPRQYLGGHLARGGVVQHVGRVREHPHPPGVQHACGPRVPHGGKHRQPVGEVHQAGRLAFADPEGAHHRVDAPVVREHLRVHIQLGLAQRQDPLPHLGTASRDDQGDPPQPRGVSSTARPVRLPPARHLTRRLGVRYRRHRSTTRVAGRRKIHNQKLDARSDSRRARRCRSPASEPLHPKRYGTATTPQVALPT